MNKISKPNSIFSLFFRSISRRERQKIGLLLITQILINLVDLVGVGFLGIVGAITISGIQSRQNSSNILQILEFLQLESRTFQTQVLILSVAATTLLISRTLISLYLSKRTFLYFASKSISLSVNILSNLFRNGLEKLQIRGNQDLIYSTTQGCDILMIGVFAQSTILVSDIALLTVMGIGVAVLQPATAILSLIIFGAAATYMQLVLNKKAKRLGQIGATQAIINNRKIQEIFSSYREIYVGQNQEYLIGEVETLRSVSAQIQAEINFLPIVNKYFLETTLLVGALSVSAVEFAINDALKAMSGLAIFLAAGSRIAPALLRVQQNLLNIRNSIGGAQPTIKQLEDLEIGVIEHENWISNPTPNPTQPDIVFQDVTFQYQNNTNTTIQGISFVIEAGTSVAITGPSGSGKTTLVDLMLGMLTPKSGSIYINGKNPKLAIERSDLEIAYVPQDIRLISGTLLANIALGVATDQIILDRVKNAIEKSQLTEFINSLSDGLNTMVGEEGILLSGGQRQRIGIARALYKNPKLLVLDEPTSALDQETEEFIASTIESLKRTTTIVVIAHRLNTLKNMDKVFYVESGNLVAVGSFTELRMKIKDFDENAISSGL